MGKVFLIFYVFTMSALAVAGENTTWFYTQNKQVKGVILLGHGLNLRPSKMDALAAELNIAGYDVLRVAFAGHRSEEQNDWFTVKTNDWLADAVLFYSEAQKRAKRLRVPLNLVAYSFSAAIYELMSHEQTGELISFKKRIYLAPGIWERAWAKFVMRSLLILPDKVSLPSANTAEYRMHDYTSVRALRSEFELLSKIQKVTLNKLEPTLVVMSEKDELVDYVITKERGENLGWNFFDVAKNKPSKSRHHLVIDEQALGKPEWQRVVQGALLEFLN